MLNTKPTVINPQVPGEQPPAGTPVPLREYLARMFRYCSQSLRQIFEWQRSHLELTPPLYEEDPHIQYWHKRNSSAYAGLYFHDMANPRTLSYGGVFNNYSGELLLSWNAGASAINGTIIIDPEENGVYFGSISGYAEGQANTSYVLTVHRNGQPTLLRCPMIFKGTTTTSSFSNSVIFKVVPGTFDLRLEHPTGGEIIIYDVKFYLIRYLDESVGAPPASTALPPVDPIPPDWGKPP